MRCNRPKNKISETPKFVIPANAGIQSACEAVDFNSWMPTPAGVTSHPLNSTLKQCARRYW